jgi:hypothetical protein
MFWTLLLLVTSQPPPYRSVPDGGFRFNTSYNICEPYKLSTSNAIGFLHCFQDGYPTILCREYDSSCYSQQRIVTDLDVSFNPELRHGVPTEVQTLPNSCYGYTWTWRCSNDRRMIMNRTMCSHPSQNSSNYTCSSNYTYGFGPMVEDTRTTQTISSSSTQTTTPTTLYTSTQTTTQTSLYISTQTTSQTSTPTISQKLAQTTTVTTTGVLDPINEKPHSDANKESALTKLEIVLFCLLSVLIIALIIMIVKMFCCEPKHIPLVHERLFENPMYSDHVYHEDDSPTSL